MLLNLVDMESGSWRRPISLTVNVGETILLLGRNGAGKTTLLNTIAGLLPVRSGRITIDEHNSQDFQSKRKPHAVGIALQDRNVFGRLSVRKNLLLGAYRRSEDREVAQDLEWVLTLFPDLEEKLDLLAKTLSGGQQTMLSIGRALMGRPRLLLMDEPTLGLAPQSVSKLIRAVGEIAERRNVGMIVAEQSGPFARAFPQRIILLAGGEILFDGNWGEAQDRGALSEIFV
jgi:branched-chain amino acid transport system ATP-binding protein